MLVPTSYPVVSSKDGVVNPVFMQLAKILHFSTDTTFDIRTLT